MLGNTKCLFAVTGNSIPKVMSQGAELWDQFLYQPQQLSYGWNAKRSCRYYWLMRGFQMTIQELGTIFQTKVPVKIVV
jgi:hypothetical protein